MDGGAWDGEAEAGAPRLESLDLAGVAGYLAGGARRVVVMMGAGASVSAGIPDFRSPETGLYARVRAAASGFAPLTALHRSSRSTSSRDPKQCSI
jgi:NAD-dependent SIR2 family protein deacetylase